MRQGARSQSRAHTEPQEPTRARTAALEILAAWLPGHLGIDDQPRLQDVPPAEATGFSHETFVIDLTWPKGAGPNGLVLRFPPEPDAWPIFRAYDLSRQATAMRAVRAAGTVEVPEVLAVDEDGGLLGRPFLMMERIPGVAASDVPPYTYGGWFTDLTPRGRAEVAAAALRVLAGIHAVPLTPAQRRALSLPGTSSSALRRHFDDQREHYQWASGGRSFPTIDAAFDELERRWPRAEPPAALSWGDARLGNILWRGTTPTAALDWESATLAPPEVDLTWMLYFADYFQRSAERAGRPGAPGFLTEAQGVPHYERLAGRAVRDLEWYLLYACLRQSLVFVRVMDRAVHSGQMPRPLDPEELLLDRAHLQLLTQRLAGPA